MTFTPREQQIIDQVLRGKTTKEIGEAIFLSESGVKWHLYKLFKKLGVKSKSKFILKVSEVRK